jgi:NAD(P)-dependent dehydrogenase (short-subunit alcohol dehydrogenase family)
MSSGLRETVALITGATGGIGKPTASALADRGANTLMGGRNAERGEQGRPAAAHQGVGGRVRRERGPGQRRQPPDPPGPRTGQPRSAPRWTSSQPWPGGAAGFTR